MLRLPEGMRDRLKDAADQNGRSMNSEIVHRLDSFDQLKDTIKRYEQEIQKSRQRHDAVARILNEEMERRREIEAEASKQQSRLEEIQKREQSIKDFGEELRERLREEIRVDLKRQLSEEMKDALVRLMEGRKSEAD